MYECETTLGREKIQIRESLIKTFNRALQICYTLFQPFLSSFSIRMVAGRGSWRIY